jgi:hypothetical protein
MILVVHEISQCLLRNRTLKRASAMTPNATANNPPAHIGTSFEASTFRFTSLDSGVVAGSKIAIASVGVGVSVSGGDSVRVGEPARNVGVRAGTTLVRGAVGGFVGIRVGVRVRVGFDVAVRVGVGRNVGVSVAVGGGVSVAARIAAGAMVTFVPDACDTTVRPCASWNRMYNGAPIFPLGYEY